MWHPFDDSWGLHDPNTTERGLRRPLKVALWSLLNKIPRLMSFILPRNSAAKGIGVKENLLWNPFDELRGLHDPNASEGGLQIPLKVAL